jgi:GT2 family glycosyltransferase
MKFEHKYPNATSKDKFEFEYSFVIKTPKLGQCRWCGSFTKWLDLCFQHHACSEECLGAMWRQFKSDQKKNSIYGDFENHFNHVKDELRMADEARDAWKDIIIIVRNQLNYFSNCIKSIRENTTNYHLYIWDNGSDQKTQDYIDSLVREFDAQNENETHWKITTMRSEVNTGFIAPNNELAAWGDSEYIILLNSDTKVFKGWDRAMIGFLETHPDVAQVGYFGGHMGPDGRGFGGANGYEIDYIPGWCFCISRETYNRFGLFSPQLQFAYCEDADLSLRLKEAGKKIYALYAPLVHHYQNKTIVEVEKEGQVDVRATFEANHNYIKKRWKHYLEHDRVLLKQRRTDSHKAPTTANERLYVA